MAEVSPAKMSLMKRFCLGGGGVVSARAGQEMMRSGGPVHLSSHQQESTMGIRIGDSKAGGHNLL